MRIEDIEEDEHLDSFMSHKTVFVLIDRLVVKAPPDSGVDEEDNHRIADSVNTAFYEGEGEVILEINGKEVLHFSNKYELSSGDNILTMEYPMGNDVKFWNEFHPEILSHHLSEKNQF